MSQNDFNAHDLRGLTLEEQIAKCHAMAAEAEGFAAVNHDNRDGYMELAAKWSQLAEEMGRALYSREAEVSVVLPLLKAEYAVGLKGARWKTIWTPPPAVSNAPKKCA